MKTISAGITFLDVQLNFGTIWLITCMYKIIILIMQDVILAYIQSHLIENIQPLYSTSNPNF